MDKERDQSQGTSNTEWIDVPSKLHRKNSIPPEGRLSRLIRSFYCDEYHGKARKKKTCSDLSLIEKLNIVNSALVEKEPFDLISNEYDVKSCTIKYLCMKARKDPDYFTKI